MADMDWHDTETPALPGAAPMQQHPAYAATSLALGRQVRWLRLGPAHAPMGSALVLCRRWPGLGRAALVSRGPVWVDNLAPAVRQAALVSLIDRLRRDHVVVIATPDPIAGADPLAGSGLLPLVTPITLATLDLGGGAAVRRARLRGKWRNALTRAEAAPLHTTATPLPPDPDHWLLRAEAAQARARRYRRLPGAFAVAWARANPADTLLLAAHAATGPVAGMLFLRHGSMASYHIGWTSAEGRKASAHTRLMWEGIARLAAAGVARLDLDMIDTETAPGLARFKLGTGAEAVRLGATRIAAPGTAYMARLMRAPAPVAGTGPRAVQVTL
ncbi:MULTISPECIES: GNAT family N-acetyltransferase [Meridianimarinicoccus]|uniref:GNAT family N-acetyltransferase n=1 Tax=Meridianimarinicoccus zhengii TaxID=2056810 RepID=UPI000DAEFE7C|nr:GNAT family N-acetyltransferase [Phycocomes zhengii]